MGKGLLLLSIRCDITESIYMQYQLFLVSLGEIQVRSRSGNFETVHCINFKLNFNNNRYCVL